MARKTTTHPAPTDPAVAALDAELTALERDYADHQAALPALEAEVREKEAAVAAAVTERETIGRDLQRVEARHATPTTTDEHGRTIFLPRPPASGEGEVQLAVAARDLAGEYERADKAETRARVAMNEAAKRVGERRLALRMLDDQRAALTQKRQQLMAAQAVAPSETTALAAIRDRIAKAMAGDGGASSDSAPQLSGSRVDVQLEKTVYVTRGWDRAVDEGDPDAAILLGRAGCVATLTEGVVAWLKEQGVRSRRVAV